MKKYGFEFDISGSAIVFVLAENKDEAIHKIKHDPESLSELNEWNVDYPRDFDKYADSEVLSYLACEDEYTQPEEKKTIHKEFKPVEKIIEGVDLNYDLLQLLGYVYSLGETEREMPSAHVIALHQRFLDLYDNQKPNNLLIVQTIKDAGKWINSL